MSESRVEQWKRKLLDLSLRNPLLNVRDPEDAGRFILGIECDGKKYASQHTVRDRDVLREDVLKSMGWKLFHAWSVDWTFDRNRAEERLLAMLPKNSCQIAVVGAPNAISTN